MRGDVERETGDYPRLYISRLPSNISHIVSMETENALVIRIRN